TMGNVLRSLSFRKCRTKKLFPLPATPVMKKLSRLFASFSKAFSWQELSTHLDIIENAKVGRIHSPKTSFVGHMLKMSQHFLRICRFDTNYFNQLRLEIRGIMRNTISLLLLTTVSSIALAQNKPTYRLEGNIQFLGQGSPGFLLLEVTEN